MSAKEKGKFEDMAKQDKVRYEREMKNYIPPKGQKKKRFKDPNAPKRPPYVQNNHLYDLSPNKNTRCDAEYFIPTGLHSSCSVLNSARR